jgi:hypothetical protein
MEFIRHRDRRFQHLLSAPFIYSVIIAFVILDLFITMYQAICFPLYGLKKVDRRKYIRVRDRMELPYLTLAQRINCGYCGYGNGLLRYAVAIAQETQKYWCGIRHRPSKDFIEPAQEKDFLPYNDPEAYRDFKTGKKS